MEWALCYDDVFLEHHSQSYHPERPKRLSAIREALTEAGQWQKAQHLSTRPATTEELARVHQSDYVEQTLRRLEAQRFGHLDPDTFFSPQTRDAALRAAGCSIDLARHVWERKASYGLGLVRPPGHHAEADQARGFCIFNNIALAAASLLQAGAQRLLIFDWDVHHGNGTQHCFQNTKDVLFISVHAWPHFPGSGLSDEIGSGAGRGFTANVPYPHGATDADYGAVVERLLWPLARAFRPEMVLVSAGFDAHQRDPLGGMSVTEEGFGYLAQAVRDIAQQFAEGRLALFLEGGYDLIGLTSSVVRVLDVLEGSSLSQPPGAPTPGPQRVLDETLSHLKPFWPELP